MIPIDKKEMVLLITIFTNSYSNRDKNIFKKFSFVFEEVFSAKL